MKKLMYIMLVAVTGICANQEVMQITINACDKVRSETTKEVCIDDCTCMLHVCVEPTKSGHAKVWCTFEGTDMKCECAMPFDSVMMTHLCDNCPAVVKLTKSPECCVSICKIDSTDAAKCPIMNNMPNDCCHNTKDCCKTKCCNKSTVCAEQSNCCN